MKRWISISILLLILFFMGCSKPDNMIKSFKIEETSTPDFTVSPITSQPMTVTPTVAINPTGKAPSKPGQPATLTATMAALTLIPTASPTVTPAATSTLLPDMEAPILTLHGEMIAEVIARTEFLDPGFSAIDNCDGDVTEMVQISGEVDVNQCGTYILTYEVADRAGNQAKAERIVIVKQSEEIVPEGKVIYLTFDDGPGRYTDAILDILEKYNVKATFFTCGNGQPAQVTKIYEAGHTVGIHCKCHDYNVIYASEEAYFDDLFAMQDLIYECTGVRTTLVRFPGGSSNVSSSFNPGIMTRLTEQLEQRGFQYFDWNVSSGDSGTKNTEKILSNMKQGVESHKWSVVLQHPETREYSMKAVEDFIVWALENGYTFLTLDNTSPRAHHTLHN